MPQDTKGPSGPRDPQGPPTSRVQVTIDRETWKRVKKLAIDVDARPTQVLDWLAQEGLERRDRWPG